MRLLMISLCTTGVMREHFIDYANEFTKKYDVYCVTNDNVTANDIFCNNILNIRYKRKEKIGYFSLRKLNIIKKYIKNINPDLIYVFTPHPVNILLANFLKKYKVVFQVHDPIPHSGTGKFENIVLRKQLKQYYKISCSLIVAGNNLKNQITKTYPNLEKKIKVIEFMVLNSNKFDLEKKDYEKKYDILFFGRIEYYKGLDVLFEALNILNSKYKCLVVGKGNVKNVFKNISIPNNVDFINYYISNEELANKICESKIVVLPYRDATGSLTIGISFYYKTPVICTNVGVFPEYVRDGGITIEPNDSKKLADEIVNLLEDEEKINLLSENAYRCYENNFSTNKVMNEYFYYFDQLSKIGDKANEKK